MAMPVKDLYVGEVLVPGGTTAVVDEGARAALLQVLIRVSGSAAVEADPRVRQALGNPSSYYYQYGFDETDRTLVVDGGETAARILRIGFEPSAVARLLREAGFPVWGSNRPAVLAWIAVRDEGSRRILTESDGDHPVMKALQQEARLRGVPMLFPIGDLEDSANLAPAELWGLFMDRVGEASTRYSPDVVLAGRVQDDPDGTLAGRWGYLLDGRWQMSSHVADSAGGLVEAMVGRIADALASRYAVGSDQNEVLVRVGNVDALEDYAALAAYLGSLAPVIDTLVMEVNGDEVVYRLRTEGQVEQLREIIDLDDELMLVSERPTLRYRWMRE